MTTNLHRLWIAATEVEIQSLPWALGNPRHEEWTWFPDGKEAALLTGCGPSTSSAALAWFLGRHRPEIVIGIGIAGALPGSACEVGRAYRVLADRMDDLGAETRSGELLPLGFPGLETGELHDDSPLPLPHLAGVRGITVGIASGTARTALRRRSLGADLESMEGAAWSTVCKRFDVPFVQIRAVSNLAGPRDPAAWDIPAALQALREALQTFEGDPP
ncbi:MAG: futalosine hydrolase [Fibrobacteria bacterium]|nr:futalosine hydrolase [Fibrobacteria bacterium]